MVPLTTERLLRDAQIILQRIAKDVARGPLLHRAFSSWLTQNPPPEEILGLLQFRPAPRNYEWVAMAALAEAAGWGINGAALDDGLDWLSAVALDRVGVPAPVTTDAVAQVALALAVKCRTHLEVWFSRVLSHATEHHEPSWASHGARTVLDREVASGGDPALRLALHAVGASNAKQGDERDVIDILARVRRAPPDEPLRAVVLCCALDWLRWSDFNALPKSATVDDVAGSLVEYGHTQSAYEQRAYTLGRAPVSHQNVKSSETVQTTSSKTMESTVTRHKILFLASNPTPTTRIAIDEEAREIEQKLQATKHRDTFEFTTKWAVRPRDLPDLLLREEPTIVHFSGHGSGVPGLILHGDTGTDRKLVTADALEHLFSILQDNIRVVVLNACYSEEQAKAIVNAIDFVVGINESIGDKASRVFAASFYGGLGFGRSVKTAFDLGVSAIKLEGLVMDEQRPVLRVKPGMDPDRVILIRTERTNT